MANLKLLITGGAGFIGSNFIKYILSKYQDYEVINLDKLTYCGNLENLRAIENNPRYKFIKGDICDFETVDKIVAEKPDAIVNFAAESHVDRSILDPTAFLKTSVQGTHTLLEAAKKYNIKKFIQISCYDEKTKTLTKDGIKSFNELNQGDIVFTLNPKTKKIEEKPIEKVIIQEYEGEMIRFNNTRINLLTTPNHRIYDNKMNVLEAKDCIDKTIIFPNSSGFVGKHNVSKDLMYLIGVFLGDGFTAYQEKTTKNKSGLNRKEFIKRKDKNGRFISGKTGEIKETISKSWRIFLDIPENDKARIKTETSLKNLEIKYTKQKGGSGEHLYFTSEKWVKFFNQFDRDAKNKFIPNEFLEQDSELLIELLNGLVDSDGYWETKMFTTVSDKLANNFCELAIKTGRIPNKQKRYSESVFEGRVIKGYSWMINFSDSEKSIKPKRIIKENYKGKIWCITVSNKNFLVERDGKFAFSGNTDEVYGSIENGSFKETSPLNPSSPYSAAKAAADLLSLSYFKTYNLPVIVTRSTNNFGPFQYPEKVIPLFITNLLENKKIPLYGDGLNTRDWIYVLDNCEAIDLVLHKGEAGEIYNVGGGNEKTNLELTNFILKETGKAKNFVEYVNDRLGHDRRYSLDCQKIKAALGWQPKYNFAKALKDTIQWYKENERWWKKIKTGEYLEYYKKQYNKSII